MTLLHVLHAVVVGGILTAAAASIEAGLRGAGRPGRGVWVVVLAATASAPLWGPRLAGPDPVFEGSPVVVAEAPPTEVTPASPTAWNRVGAAAALPRPVLPWIWIVLSGLSVAAVAGGLFRLERRAARWPRTVLEGERVSVSHDFGPALVGLRRPRTVLPHWVLGLARREIGLIVAHERSHRAAGDGVLLAAGLMIAALCPWNPWVWLQFKRLRDAVEMDCDHRLLGSGVSLPAYARVLVTVRLRSSAVGGATAALVESSSSLERRLKMMRAFPWTRRRVALSGAVALGLVVLACETPAPSAVEVDTEVAAQAEYEEQAGAKEWTGIVKVRPEEGQDPLVIVDGHVAAEGGLHIVKEIAAETIDRIEVVKGEAARAVYGERGANGVIHITTKEAVAEGEGDIEMPVEGTFRLRESRDLPFGEVEVPIDASFRLQEGQNVPFGIRERKQAPEGGVVAGATTLEAREITPAAAGILRKMKERAPSRDGGGGR